MSILTSNKTPKKTFDYINKTLGKKDVEKLLSKIYEDYGGAKTGNVANALKNLGFRFATLSGLTISIEDLSIPEKKREILSKAEEEIEHATHRFSKGEITEVERYTKVIDTWAQANEELTQEVVKNFEQLNPIYMMAFSGARGSIAQVRQLVGMRGLMADSQGQIIDLPIKSNFKEGLSVTEYIISSYGARKGLVDTALKTADSGYLTRRLVDVAQDVIIEEEDCNTENGIPLESIAEGDSEMVTLKDRLFSRTSAKDIYDEDGELLISAGEVFDSDKAQKVLDAGFNSVLIRSPLSCDLQYGVCRKCYGWSLTSNRLVDIGESIGIMAAQSIGEPGTQLTMRTFHTGGVFSGSASKQQMIAKADGTVEKSVPVRELRTRHGDIVEVSSRDFALEIKGSDGTETYNVPFNATILKGTKGTKVKKGDIIAEFEAGAGRGDARRLTEKAAKDIKAGLPGEIFFEGFEADEKRDRQGNITRTANRAGTIWILQGEVYNLPSGSKRMVDSDQNVKIGEILAETLIISEHGGEVRIPETLVTEKTKVGKEKVETIVEGKELTIVIASTMPENAELEQTKKEQLWKVNDDEEVYIIKSPVGTTVENESIIAELVDESSTVPSSGEIRYHEIEVDENRTLLKPGTIYFIPEEIHQVSKDISLKMSESGTFVEAGTEVVKGVITRISGILEIVEDNDIIQEVIIRPGELHRVEDPSSIQVDDGTVVDAKVEVAPGIKTTERSMISINYQIADPEDGEDIEDLEDTSNLEYAELLVRPVQEFEVEPYQVKIGFESSDDNISIESLTQLTFKDGDKIRQVEGVPLLRTSLMLRMEGQLSRLKGVVEDDEGSGNLKISVLENLIIRRESAADATKNSSSQTQLLVGHGQTIEKGTPVVKTQVLAQNNGKVSLGNIQEDKDIRRLMIIPDDDLRKVPFSGKASVKADQYIRMDDAISDKTNIEQSGQIIDVNKDHVILRIGHPYLISGGSQLQVEHNSLVQRGDLVATLIFERLKTGDIVTGLPRVEELLEGRKSKETAIIASYDAVAELEWDEDVARLFLVSDEYGRDEINVPLGANILVDDKDVVKKGQPITDGAINPHDLLDILGMDACRRYLVDEVQRVYRSQGVEISDKHIEVIVRQMSKKVKVDDAGDSALIPGEMVDEKIAFAELARMQELGEGKEPEFHHVLLGITKASLNTDSFISAASFQETTRVLTEAAIEGKIDILRGLKENVIIGRLIPAGTGFPHFKDQRDEMADEATGGSRFSSRKPSAILEEIESMFGSPEINKDTMGDLILDDDDIVIPDMSGDSD